jgi:hypothetical protein
MAIDFPDGFEIHTKLRKTKKPIFEKFEEDGREALTIVDEIPCYLLELEDTTAKDMFISQVLEEIEFCYNEDYELRGMEFVLFVQFPIATHIRTFFSEPSKLCTDWHFFVMTMETDQGKNIFDLFEKMDDGVTLKCQVIPRDQENLVGNV